MKPPPCLTHSISILSGRLSLKKITAIRTRPSTKAKLVKLWTYLAACENAQNASGPISGKSRILPKVMFRPVRPRTTKETAVSQCENRSKALKRGDLLPGASRRDPDASQDQIGRGQAGDRAEDHDRAAPMQHDLVEIVPGPPGGLDQHARLRVGNVDVAFNARRFSQQRLFVHDARVRIGCAIGPCCCARAGAETATAVQIANAPSMMRIAAQDAVMTHPPTRRSPRSSPSHPRIVALRP